ncbi:hypothetical protein IWQ61_010742 [Dispira simplex]|nr:hypothetical protein IWQ61_010742 [Dispira simplex]
MVEYSQPWITQLEVHSQVVRLGGVIQDLAQSTGEDQAAFELIEDLQKILLAFGVSTRQELVMELVTRAGLYLMTLTERIVGKVQHFIETKGPPSPLATLLIQNADKCDG